jgi:type I restriction enzyme M protein
VPRFKFRWENVPSTVLAALTVDQDVSVEAAPVALRDWYGARPKEEFVRENWDLLRESWLSSDSVARKALVEQLWNLGVGEGEEFPKNKTTELAYLRSCRNAKRLREAVLDIFVDLGARAQATVPAVKASIGISSDGKRSGEGGKAQELSLHSPTSPAPSPADRDEFLDVLLASLPLDGTPAGNGRLREQLGLDRDTYGQVRGRAKSAGLVVAGRGRGGSLALTGQGQHWLAEHGGGLISGVRPSNKPLAPKGAAPRERTSYASATGNRLVGLELSQAELESRLWAAANALRGPVDPADFKAYIFPLLFYKRISDNWAEEHARALADFGTDVNDEIEADYHRFVIPDGCHWSDLRRITENIGIALQRVFDRIQQANPEALAGIFGDVAWGNKEKLPESSLSALLDAFGSLDLSPSRVGNDVLGNAYEYLLKQFADASGQKAGEFFTPRAVVRLLTRLLDPQPTDSVYDPACGSGGMLVEAANEVLDAGGSLKQMRFYAQEVNLTTAAIARMNLYLHDIEDVKVLRGDTLRDPKFRDERGRLERFDVVIANPPFSLKNWGAKTWTSDPWGRAACGVPPANSGDLAWVQHMVASMRPDTGRVGVVMPHGVLFRGGVEGAIRQCLIGKDQLEAVVGLPSNLFYSTTIPACLLIFRGAKPAVRKGTVLFVDGSSAFAKGRNQNQMSPTDVEEILAAYRAGETGDGLVPARLVKHGEIEENGWDLNIGRYLRTAAAETVDVLTALAALRDAQTLLHEAEVKLDERLKAAGYA